jgi:hypothetical protein
VIKNYINRVLYKYVGDQFCTSHNVLFLRESNFKKSYNKACKTLGFDPNLHFRIHQIIWAAENARKIKGDFVEMGTGTGFSMLALLNYYKNWNLEKKKLYMFDTFSSYKRDELGNITSKKSKFYATSFESTKKNFYGFKRIHFVKGDIFETLPKYKKLRISLLHLDLNYAEAEVYALKTVWKNISQGGIIILDDYAYIGRERQYYHINKLSKKLCFKILTLPSGQGIVVKN